MGLFDRFRDLTEMIPMVQKYYDVIEKDGMKAAYDLVLNK